MSPLEATRKCMGQITGALIGTTLVIIAVFLPMAFFGGSTGVIYRQFSVTIMSAIALSTLVALILTPAMCASLLKPPSKTPSRFFYPAWFNRHFKSAQTRYLAITRLLRRALLSLAVLAAVGLSIVMLFKVIPSSFLPTEDQGVLMAMITLPEGSTTDQTLSVVNMLEDHLLEAESEAIDSVFSSVGFSFSGSGQNVGILFARMTDLAERSGRADLSAAAVLQRTNHYFRTHNRLGQVFMLQPPAIPGMGHTGGSVCIYWIRANNAKAHYCKPAKIGAMANQDGRVPVCATFQDQTRRQCD